MRKTFCFTLLILICSSVSSQVERYCLRAGYSHAMGVVAYEFMYGNAYHFALGAHMGVMPAFYEENDTRTYGAAFGVSAYTRGVESSGFYLYGGALLNGAYSYNSASNLIDEYTLWSFGLGYRLAWDFIDVKVGGGYGFSAIYNKPCLDLSIGLSF